MKYLLNALPANALPEAWITTQKGNATNAKRWLGGENLGDPPPEGGFVSAIGHESTANVLSQLLGVDVPCERKQIALAVGDSAIIFSLKRRLAEGQVLSEEELSAFRYGDDYEFVLVTVRHGVDQVAPSPCPLCSRERGELGSSFAGSDDAGFGWNQGDD